MKPLARLALAALVGGIPLTALATLDFPSTFRVDCDAKSRRTITRALERARDGDTISIRGTCTETLVIEKGVTLDGGGTASVAPAAPNDPTLTVLGRGVTLRGLRLESPAAFQVFVLRAAEVVLDSVEIRNARNFGISVATHSTLAMVGSTVADNGLGGMVALAQAEVTVGAIVFFDPPNPNTFVNNGPFGVVLASGSGGRIISGNTFRGHNIGIAVLDGAQARIAGNLIDGNNIGIFSDSNATVQLPVQGNAVPAFNELNSGTNAQLGIACKGGTIQGFIDGLAPAAALPPTRGALGGPVTSLPTFCLDQTERLPSS